MGTSRPEEASTTESPETLAAWNAARELCYHLNLGVYIHTGDKELFGFTDRTICVSDQETGEQAFCTVGGGKQSDPVSTLDAISFAVFAFAERLRQRADAV